MKHITTSCLIALAALAITGCDQKKTDAPAAPEPAKKEAASIADKASDAAGKASATVSSVKLPDAPKFKSDKVNTYVKDYVAYCNECIAAAKDPSKAEALQAKAVEFATKSQDAMQDLSSDADELQKFSDYMTKVGQEMAKAYQ